MASYTAIASRIGPEGTADKLALMEAYAHRWARDPRVQAAARQITSRCSSRSDDCVQAIEAHCARLPYRLEPDDVIRDPLDTLALGGDCDDFSVLVCALCLAIGIPARPQAVTDPDGVIFHVRALVGLPPAAPHLCYAIDPVFWSERAWNLHGYQCALDPRQLVPVPGSR